MEVEREKMRGDIRNKYNIQKKDDSAQLDFGADGRIGATNKKTPEQLGKFNLIGSCNQCCTNFEIFEEAGNLCMKIPLIDVF